MLLQAPLCKCSLTVSWALCTSWWTLDQYDRCCQRGVRSTNIHLLIFPSCFWLGHVKHNFQVQVSLYPAIMARKECYGVQFALYVMKKKFSKNKKKMWKIEVTPKHLKSTCPNFEPTPHINTCLNVNTNIGSTYIRKHQMRYTWYISMCMPTCDQ